MLADRVRMGSGFDGAISSPTTLFNGSDVNLVEKVTSQFLPEGGSGGFPSEVKAGYIEITVDHTGSAIYKVTRPVNLRKFTKVTFQVQVIDYNFGNPWNTLSVFATTKGILTDTYGTDGEGRGVDTNYFTQEKTKLPTVANGTWTVDVDISSFNNKEDLYVGGLGLVQDGSHDGTMRISSITIS